MPRNQTLIMGQENNQLTAPNMMNPLLPTTILSAGLHQVAIESLFYLNYQTGKLIPWLAESYSFNPDFTVLTIKLRKGAEWSDGQPLTSDDVVFTINLLKNNAPKFSYSQDMATWIKDISASDPQTVQMTLTAPNPRFVVQYFGVNIWGAVRILPKHIWQGQDPATFNNFDPAKGWPVFSGPYKVVSSSPGQTIFDLNPNWWGAKTGFHALPAPKRAVFFDQGPDERRVATLQANQADGLPSISPNGFKAVLAQNPKALAWLPSDPYGWFDPCPPLLIFNTTVKPWDDPNMRWALSYGLDKQKHANIVQEGTGILAPFVWSVYPPLQKIIDDNKALFSQYNTLEYNVAKARQLMEAKGYKKGGDGIYVGSDGKRLTLNLLVTNPALAGGSAAASAQDFAFQFKQLGIDTALKELSSTQFSAAFTAGQFEIAPGRVYCGSTVDPWSSMNNFNASWVLPIGQPANNNYGRYNNKAFSALVDKMGTISPDDPQTGTLFSQSLEMWLKDLPAFGLNQQLRTIPYVSTYWTNWPTSKNGYIHPPNWWMTSLAMFAEIKPTGAS